jgi:alcohol dehydrogenase
MKALVYAGPGLISVEDRPDPVVFHPADAVVRLTAASLCGTDLHILRGDVPTVASGRILGHEGVGVVETVGSDVGSFRPGDRVLVSLNTSCGRCDFCRKGMPSHCRHGGWNLGNTIDGTQAQRVRVPYADTGLHPLPDGVDDEAAVLLSCCFPTSYECGAVAGQVKPGDRVAIVGAGPVGLATLLACRLFSPLQIIVIDLDDHRLEAALALGATQVVDSTGETAIERVMALTNGEGVDVAVEAVGLPATFDLCQSILAPGGHLANVGVHGGPVSLHLNRLWAANITLTARLVDALSTPMLVKLVETGRLSPRVLISHRFAFTDVLKAYDTFGRAADNRAVKVVLSFDHLP